MLWKAKHLQVSETHRIARAQTISFGRTNHAPRSKTLTASRNAPNSKSPNYIFWTNEQCPAKQNTYGPATKKKPKLHLSEERTVPREAKHVRLHKTVNTQTTYFGRTNDALRSKTLTASRIQVVGMGPLKMSFGEAVEPSPGMTSSCRKLHFQIDENLKTRRWVFEISPSTSRAWRVF